MYYNPSYNNINFNLWIFINNAHYGYDNYANYSLGPSYARHVFDRRLVRITNRPIDRSILERIVKQKIRETPVEVRELQTDKRTIKVVVPTGSDDINRIRKHSKEVVRDIIAPGFAESKKSFKGQNSKNKEVVTKIFHQENVQPKVEDRSSEQIIDQAREAKQNREQSRVKREQAEKVKIERIEKEGKLQEPKKGNTAGTPDLKGGKQAQDKDAVKKDQTDSPQDSNLKDKKVQPDKNSKQKSKDKKSTAKTKDKNKHKEQNQEQNQEQSQPSQEQE